MASELVDNKACEETTGVTKVTFADTVGATATNADKAVLKTTCMDACIAERTSTASSYCCQVVMTPDDVAAPTSYTSACNLWTYTADVLTPADSAADETTGVSKAAANILGVAGESAKDGAVQLSLSAVTLIALFVY